MNPNAPFHHPDVVRDVVLTKWAADKLWSPPDHKDARALTEYSARLNYISTDMEKRKIERQRARLPPPKNLIFPSLTRTPKRSISNVSSTRVQPVRVDLRHGLMALKANSGTNAATTDVYIQFVCDFANQWHSKLTGIDCRSPGTDPMFYCLDQDFFDLIMNGDKGKSFATQFPIQHLTRDQFWKLRYLFIPVSFRVEPQPFHHVALCAISPEARTVDYVCSGGDNGMPYSSRSAGSKCVPIIFAWLAHLLGTDQITGFLPYDWRYRNTYGLQQIETRKDCGIYTVTHALALAFGYGLHQNGPFAMDHNDKIIPRRKRYVQDLMKHGFAFYDENEEGGGSQYYPLLDVVPSSSQKDGFSALHDTIIATLPKWAQNRRACYFDCPSKEKLLEHCARNKRFYPGYERSDLSGEEVGLRAFLTWVEAMDRRRKSGKWQSLPYPQHKPKIWIDPRNKDPNVEDGKLLWPRAIVAEDVDVGVYDRLAI